MGELTEPLAPSLGLLVDNGETGLLLHPGTIRGRRYVESVDDGIRRLDGLAFPFSEKGAA